MKYLTTMGVTLLLTQNALACPKEMDAANGIVLTRASTFFSALFKPKGEGITEQRIMIRGAEPEDISSFYPHPLVIGKHISKNGELNIEYKKPLVALDELNNTNNWVSEVVVKSGDTEIGTGTAVVSFIGYDVITIGECTYDVWRISDRLELKDSQPIIFEKYFSPELKLVLASITMSNEGEPISGVMFDEIKNGVNY